jgi:hypothetical protein
VAGIAIAATSTLALAGGENCRPRMPGMANPSAADIDSAIAGRVYAAPAISGYCPGGLSGANDHGGDVGAADAEEVSARANLDAVDAAMILKNAYVDVAAWIRAVKFEPGDTKGEVKTDPHWKIEFVCGSEEWLAKLDAKAGTIIDIKYVGGAKATGAPDVEEIAVPARRKPAIHLGCATTNCGVEDALAKQLPEVETADAMDMFEAFDLLAEKLEEQPKDLPDPVPAKKITDRPHPKKKKNDSTGSRW